MKKDPRSIAKECVEQCLATRLRQISRLVTNRYDEALREFGVTSNQASMLAVIAVLGNPTPGELEPILLMDASTISRNVKLLLANQWVALIPSDDRRSHRLVIAPAGAELMLRAYPAWAESQRWARKVLGPSGVQNVRNVARRVNPAVP
jgi:DNA-binding MarR family transcriptional regulator